MAEVRKHTYLEEVEPGVYRFADAKQAESRVRRQLAELFRRNLELWKQIRHGDQSLWRETEALIRWLENAQG